MAEDKKDEKPTARKLRCLHVFLLKKLKDDKDVEGGLMMVGTFVQRVFDLTEDEMKEQLNAKDQEPFFGYRFNESSSTDDYVNVRRIEPLMFDEVNEHGKTVKIYGTRTTVEVSIPLEMDSLVSAFPFQVNLATAAIELSSIADTERTIRSDFILHESDPRFTIAIQNKSNDKTIKKRLGLLKDDKNDEDKDKDLTREDPEKMIDEILDRIDKTKVYEFLSPYPEVYYEYDGKKEYCPRFTLSFYVVEPGFSKLVTILLPMVLVTFLAILNTVNDWMMNCDDVTDENGNPDPTCTPGEEPSNHIQVTSALTLTIVFVLPQMLNERGNRDKLLTSENISIIVFFFALILSSVPRSIASAGSAIPEIVGVVVMACAALFMPLYNIIKYYGIKGKIHDNSLAATKKGMFLMDETHKQWKEHHGLSAFFTVGELIKNKNFKDKVYLASENKKRLWWNREN